MQLHRLNRNRGGFTLAETVIASMIALSGIGAAMTLNGAHLKLVKSSRQSNAATLALQERVEQMRVVNWRNMTSASYLQNTLMAKAPSSVGPLDRPVERITVCAYPDPSAAEALVVERGSSGACRLVSGGEGLTTKTLAQVKLRMSWTGSDGRERSRETTTVISNGGISRLNLPSMGSVSGGTNGDGSTSTTGTTTDTTTPTDSTSGSGSGTTDSTGNNGNGNGNGNSTTTTTPTTTAPVTTTTTDTSGNTTTTTATTTTSGSSTTNSQTTTTTDSSGAVTNSTTTTTTTTSGNNGNGNGNTTTTTTTTTTDASGNTTSTTSSSSNNGNSSSSSTNNGRGNVNGKSGKN